MNKQSGFDMQKDIQGEGKLSIFFISGGFAGCRYFGVELDDFSFSE